MYLFFSLNFLYFKSSSFFLIFFCVVFISYFVFFITHLIFFFFPIFCFYFLFFLAYFELLHNASWSAAHTKLSAVLTLAITIDIMKPATIGFIMPGENYSIFQHYTIILIDLE